MSAEQPQPRMCPLCGSSLITQILCDTLLSAHFRGMECPSEGVVAYHCEGSHVFLVLRNDFRWGQPICTEPEVTHRPEKVWSLGSALKDQFIPKVLSPLSFLWLLAGTILNRQERFQTLGLVR